MITIYVQLKKIKRNGAVIIVHHIFQKIIILFAQNNTIFILSHHILFYFVLFHFISSLCRVTSHHIISHHVISHHITSHHILSHFIVDNIDYFNDCNVNFSLNFATLSSTSLTFFFTLCRTTLNTTVINKNMKNNINNFQDIFI